MKFSVLAAIVAALGLVTSIQAASRCQEGETYWCQSMTTAHQCNRMQYCQEKVWVKLPQGTITCLMCEMVVGFITKELKSNTTEDEMKDIVLEVCNYLGPFKSTCQGMIEVYFDEMWDQIMSKVDPDVICALVKLCSSSVQNEKAMESKFQSGEMCEVCELAVGFLKVVVDGNSTESEVEELLKTVCNAVPSKLQANCNYMIEEFFPTIWNLLKMEVDNDQLCQLMQICSSSSKKRLVSKK